MLLLDENILKREDINSNDLIYLYKKVNKESILDAKPNLSKLIEKGFISSNNGSIYLKQKALDLINILDIEISLSSDNKKKIKKSDRLIKEQVDSFIDDYRNLWKGLRVGSMGSKKACYDKMYRWIKENPEYTTNEIMEAAHTYLTSVKDLRFLQRADYFIFKQNNKKEESSRLSAFIDDITTDSGEEDWITTLN